MKSPEKKSVSASVLKRTATVTSSPSLSPPPPLGRERLGRYDVIYPISWGGMASVYAGRLSGIAGFQKLVAIKVVHSHLATEENFIRMFLDEARLAAGIHHPNVGEVIEVGEDHGLYYMVGELILGQSLKAVFRRAAKSDVVIPHFVSAHIASCVCHGLHAAHELKGIDAESLGLVHRDVSPRNILLTYDGFIKLIDFGVAYAQGRISHTDEGTLKGKIGYMSPEQLRCEPVDRRSDIFSLGVVLYEMVTGREPFYGKNDLERYNKMMRYQFDKPRDVAPDLSPFLEKIILKAMAKYPDERYPTATALGADLDEYVRQTDEVGAPKILPKTMNTLFQDEQAYHIEKVREYRKNGSASMLSASGWVGLNTEKTKPYSLRAIRQRQRELTASRRRKILVAALISASFLIALFVFGVAVKARTNVDASWDEQAEAGGQSYAGRASSDEQCRRARATECPPATGRSGQGLKIGVPEPSADNGWPMVAAQKGEVSEIASRGRVEADVSRGPTNRCIARAGVSRDSISTSVVNLSLALSPPNASVALDGIAYGRGTKIISLPANGSRHRLRVFAEDYREKTVIFTADSDKSMTISLVPNRSATRKRRGPQWSRKLAKKRRASILEASPYQ